MKVVSHSDGFWVIIFKIDTTRESELEYVLLTDIMNILYTWLCPMKDSPRINNIGREGKQGKKNMDTSHK